MTTIEKQNTVQNLLSDIEKMSDKEIYLLKIMVYIITNSQNITQSQLLEMFEKIHSQQPTKTVADNMQYTETEKIKQWNFFDTLSLDKTLETKNMRDYAYE